MPNHPSGMCPEPTPRDRREKQPAQRYGESVVNNAHNSRELQYGPSQTRQQWWVKQQVPQKMLRLNGHDHNANSD